MKAANAAPAAAPRFDVNALREYAGEQAFVRGEDYHSGGAVQLLALEPDRVFATVSGTENYTVTLSGGGFKFKGSCSCPAFAERGFCKHIVAVALAVNTAVIDEEPGGFASISRLRAYLKAKSADALAEMILDMAERDHVLFRKLDMAAAAAQESGKALEARLKKALDAATRTHGFIAWREAADWAAGVEDALDAIGGLASDSRASLALKLAERTIDRIGVAMNDIDDSDGHCGDLLARARDIHLAAARTARRDPQEFARDLFAREMGDSYDTFSPAAPRYADVLGEEGLAEYRRLAAAAWDELPSRVPQRNATQRNATQRNATQRNATQRNATKNMNIRVLTPRWPVFLIISPNATATPLPVLLFAPRTSPRLGIIISLPSFVFPMGGTRRRSNGPRKRCGCSKMARWISGFCFSS